MSRPPANDFLWTTEGGHRLRNGTPDAPGGLMYPERCIGEYWQPGAVAAEVKRALARPAHSKCDPAPEPVPEPPQMSLNAMARQLGISPAGLFQRVKRHGWSKAVAMGGRKAHRWAA